VVIAGAVTAATGVLALSLAPSLWVAGIANVVIGVGMTGLNGFASPVIVENSDDAERGRIFATSAALTTMGFVVALAVSGAVGEVLTPRQGVFLGSTLCLVALAVNGARVMREVNRKRLGVA
jgi:MFS family permease